MMVKGLLGVDESMSNLTSTVSGEGSISSNTRNDSSSTATNTMLYPRASSSSSFVSEAPPSKKKRSLPGNPDPDADVIALSPKSLLATNRFMCEICNKGFQRDQNLQLHRRGHNLPWKLKQRNNNEPIRKKVYVCPEPSCVHHHPSRALGDLTGIKKHYCRKHGEKKWKCDKCSKKYAVQSDWKAHSKICGTREYRCDCGTIFSRRDSFITHRAFCDALAEESARAINPMSTLPSLPQVGGERSTTTTTLSHVFVPQLSSNPRSLPLKREQHDQHHLIPPWLGCPPPPQLQSQHIGLGPLSGPSSQVMDPSGHMFLYQRYGHQNHDSNPNLDHAGSTLSSFQTLPPPQMSATALLQKATQIGVAMSNGHHQQTSSSHGVMVNNYTLLPQPHSHMSTGSREESHHHNHHHEQQVLTSSTTFLQGHEVVSSMTQSSMLHDMMTMNPLQSIEDFDNHHQGMVIASNPPPAPPPNGGKTSGVSGISGNGGGGDGLTRDFLGLRTFSHKDFLNMEALEQMSSSPTSFSQQQEDQQGQTPW